MAGEEGEDVVHRHALDARALHTILEDAVVTHLLRLRADREAVERVHELEHVSLREDEHLEVRIDDQRRQVGDVRLVHLHAEHLLPQLRQADGEGLVARESDVHEAQDVEPLLDPVHELAHESGQRGLRRIVGVLEPVLVPLLDPLVLERGQVVVPHEERQLGERPPAVRARRPEPLREESAELSLVEVAPLRRALLQDVLVHDGRLLHQLAVLPGLPLGRQLDEPFVVEGDEGEPGGQVPDEREDLLAADEGVLLEHHAREDLPLRRLVERLRLRDAHGVPRDVAEEVGEIGQEVDPGRRDAVEGLPVDLERLQVALDDLAEEHHGLAAEPDPVVLEGDVRHRAEPAPLDEALPALPVPLGFDPLAIDGLGSDQRPSACGSTAQDAGDATDLMQQVAAVLEDILDGVSADSILEQAIDAGRACPASSSHSVSEKPPKEPPLRDCTSA